MTFYKVSALVLATIWLALAVVALANGNEISFAVCVVCGQVWGAAAGRP